MANEGVNEEEWKACSQENVKIIFKLQYILSKLFRDKILNKALYLIICFTLSINLGQILYLFTCVAFHLQRNTKFWIKILYIHEKKLKCLLLTFVFTYVSVGWGTNTALQEGHLLCPQKKRVLLTNHKQFKQLQFLVPRDFYLKVSTSAQEKW